VSRRPVALPGALPASALSFITRRNQVTVNLRMRLDFFLESSYTFDDFIDICHICSFF